MNLESPKRDGTQNLPKGLMLNEGSHQPDHIKQASISNTYPTICSIDALLKEAEQQSFKRKAIRNCYDSGYVDRVEQNSLKNVRVETRPYDKSCKGASKCPICLNSSASIPCSQKDVVYLTTCDLCGREAVSETSWPLVVRYKGRLYMHLCSCASA